MSRDPRERPGEASPPEGPSARGSDPTITNLAAPNRLAVGTRVAGRYRIEEMLGMGAMGIVYRAEDEELGVEVALKVLRPDLGGDPKVLERFRRELVLARQVTHKHAVRIHDLGRDGDLVFLTMDLVAGRSLRQVLEERGALPVEDVLRIGRQLAEALAAAHERGVVHRDLKPSNVMLDGEDEAFITDFGVARSLTSAGLTGTDLVVGTPQYLAPEQARGEEVDGRADLYALGMLLYELLSGELPFSGHTAQELMAQHLRGVPSRLTGLPKGVPANLRAILKRCLEPDRRRRYQDASAVAADLASLARPSWQAPSARQLGRGLAVGGLLVVLGAVGLLLWRWARPPGEPAAGEAGTALVILPFADETGRSELAWLADGLPELLFESLVAQPGVRVVNPQRVSAVVADLKLAPGTLSEATLALAADLFDSSRLLTGTVRGMPGGGIRIDARLANPSQGLSGAAFLQTEVAPGPNLEAEVVDRFEAALLDELRVPPVASASAPLRSPALPLYSEAMRRLGGGAAGDAVSLLEEAVDEDGGFGAAWLRLSQAYETLGRYEEALEVADRAVATLEDDGEDEDRFLLLARAQRARLSGEPDRAATILSELVEAYPGDIESALELADAYAGQGRFGEALELLGELVERAPAEAEAWYLRAKYSILSGGSRVAVDDYLVRALVLQNKLKNRRGQADVLNAFGVGYRELGEVEQAERSYGQAAELRKELGDRRGYATTLRNLAQIRIFRGEVETAAENLEAAREIHRELGDRVGIADVLNELGTLEESRSDYRAALGYYRAALQIRRELGDQRAIAESLNNIGFANHQLGEYDDASVYWQQALDIHEETGNLEGQTVVRLSVGQLHATRGEWQDAQESLARALEGARTLQWTPAIASAETQLGRIAQFQGRYAPALAHYDDALALFGEIGDDRGRVETSLGKAEALLELGLPERGLEVLESIRQPLEVVGGADQRAEALRLEGLAFHDRGEGAAAASALDESSRLSSESGNQELVLRVRLSAVEIDPSLPELEELVTEVRALGDRRLELRTELALAQALLDAGRKEETGAAVTRLERLLRRTGDWAQSFRVHELRARRSRLAGEDPAPWTKLKGEEIRRLTEGLPAELAGPLLRRAGDPGGEVAA